MSKKALFNLAAVAGFALSLALIITSVFQGRSISKLRAENIEMSAVMDSIVSVQLSHARQDSTLAVAINNVGQTNTGLLFDVNRAFTFVAKESGINVDSIWAFVRAERTAKVEKEKALAEKKEAGGNKEDPVSQAIK